MALTPVEIRHMKPGMALFGYKRPAMDRLLDEIAASFEDVWRERAAAAHDARVGRALRGRDEGAGPPGGRPDPR